MSNLSTLPKGDSAWLLRKAIERIIQQVSVLETNIGSSTTGNSTNTQVIFNDNGTLRGDAAFTFVPSTDILTVTGFKTFGTTQLSTIGILYVGTIATPKLKVDVAGTGITTITQADITGDLTVRTNKLRVTSIGVGANTLTPAASLHSTATTTYDALTLDSDSASTYCAQNWKINGVQKAQAFLDYADDSLLIRTNTATGAVRFGCNDIEQYRIAPLGVFNWYDGAGGTRMTLNSTGLGIGVTSPATKLDVRGANNASQATFSGTASRGLLISTRSDGLADDRTVILNAQHSTGSLGQLVIQTAGTDRLLVDSTGNVGIGVTPSAWDTAVFKAIQIGTGVGRASVASRTDNVNNTAYGLNYYYGSGDYRYIAAGRATSYEQASGKHFWNIDSGTQVIGAATSFTQAMTLDASGNLLVGKTALSSATAGIQLEAVGAVTSTRSAGAAAYFNRLTSDGFLVLIGRQSSIVGDISVTTTGTTFNSTSDYRLKEAVQPLVGGLARVSALKPSVYKWKANGSAGEGFLAHELAEVVPAAVTGEKDAVNADGSIKAQSIDMSRVVPILVAAIQELTARVQTLEAR